MGSSNKRRAIGEQKALCDIRLGDHEDTKKSEDYVPLKVCKTMTPEAIIAVRSGVKVYSCPGVFGGKQLVKARDQVGRSVKMGISWDG